MEKEKEERGRSADLENAIQLVYCGGGSRRDERKVQTRKAYKLLREINPP